MFGIYSEPEYLEVHRKIIFSKFNFLKKEYGKFVELEAIVNEDESRLSAKFYKPSGEIHLNIEIYSPDMCKVDNFELYRPDMCKVDLDIPLNETNKKSVYRQIGTTEELDRYIDFCLRIVNVY